MNIIASNINRDEKNFYDVIVIGSGAAGNGAAIYLAEGLSNKKIGMFVGEQPGGQISTTWHVSNYLCFELINGMELADKMLKHSAKYPEIEHIFEQVIKIENISPNLNKVITESGEFFCHFIVIATGSSHKKLGNETKFINKGISYCAICDGRLYKNKVVAVVGGGNSAFESALYLLPLVSKIYIVHRRNDFRAFPILQNKLKQLDSNKIEFVLDSEIIDFQSTNPEHLEWITVLNKKTNEKRNINVDGVFVAIGHNPNTQFLKNTLDLDRENYIQTVDFQTSIPGVFACGDCIVQYTDRSYQHTVKRYKQAIVAASDGCIAALQIIELMLNFK